MANGFLEFLGRRMARFLSQPIKGFAPLTTANPAAFERALRRADVILVEGNTRVSSAIKYLTQSTWSHAALYVGPIPGRTEADGEPHVIVEADLDDGVISVPLSKYSRFHTRICRPVGMAEADAAKVCDYAIGRIGHAYDMKNIFDLLRYFLPTPPVPTKFRRRMIALGAGSPTQAICSTLIAQAFETVRYPILADVTPQPGDKVDRAIADSREERRQEVMRIRHHSLYAPRDFDISPYFAIVKPSIEIGFDYKALVWAEGSREPPPAAAEGP